MADIIDLIPVISKKREDSSLNKFYDKHDEVLDLCEDLFPDGTIVIALDEKTLQVSSTIKDKNIVIGMLIETLKNMDDPGDDAA